MGWEAVTPSDEVQAAQWISERLHPFAQDVGSVVPPGFDAYARIFHPAWKSQANAEMEVRWSEVAAWSGRTVHAEMQFHSIATPVPGSHPGHSPWSGEPRLGVLSKKQASALVVLLARHTSTPQYCRLCLWDGYGYLYRDSTRQVAYLWKQGEPKPPSPSLTSIRPRPEVKKHRVRLPARNYLLFTGSVTEAEGWQDGPNLWWPEDRSWCVASEIDFPYTYVGGAGELIEEILAHPRLEAMPATTSQGITAYSDTINS